MIKDGRQYLVLVRSKITGEDDYWLIVKWGVPAAFSDVYQRQAWVSNMFALREPEFLKFYELDSVLMTMNTQESFKRMKNENLHNS